MIEALYGMAQVLLVIACISFIMWLATEADWRLTKWTRFTDEED